MAPSIRARQSLSKDKFSSIFGSLKTVAYSEAPTQRGTSSHGIRSIAWNPLSTLVATAAGTTLRVWNPEKPHARFSTELKGHTVTIEKVAFNPVKDAELCSVDSDGVVKFWDVRTKNCINEVRGLGQAFTLTWAPNGESLVVGNKADKIFVLSPTQTQPLSSHQQPQETNQISFCWGGQKLFVATGDGNVRILKEHMLHGHTSSCLSVEMQPSARYLATGGSDSIIALWDTKDWICQRTLSSMVGAVNSLSFTFDGSYIVGGSDDGNGLDVCHVETGELVHKVRTAGSCPIVAWAPTKYCLAYSDVGSLRIIGVDANTR